MIGMKRTALPILAFTIGLAAGWHIVRLYTDTSIASSHIATPEVMKTSNAHDQSACKQMQIAVNRKPRVMGMSGLTIKNERREREKYIRELAQQDFDQRLKNDTSSHQSAELPAHETIQRESSHAEDFGENTISEEWAKSHIKGLTSSIGKISSKGIAESIGKLIGEESQYVKPRERVMNDSMDQDWAQYKQNELRYIIQSSPYAADFKLSSINCKQLMCELIGAIKIGGSWEAIFNEINTQAENIIPPWEADEQLFSTISIDDKGNQVVYAAFAFSA